MVKNKIIVGLIVSAILNLFLLFLVFEQRNAINDIYDYKEKYRNHEDSVDRAVYRDWDKILIELRECREKTLIEKLKNNK